jgi:hypothetical protein
MQDMFMGEVYIIKEDKTDGIKIEFYKNCKKVDKSSYFYSFYDFPINP